MRGYISVFVVLVLGFGPAVFAQPKAEGEYDVASGDVKQLRRRLDDIEKRLAETPSALEAVRKIQEEVTAFSKELRRLRGILRGPGETRARIDAMQRRVDDLEIKLSSFLLPRGNTPNADALSGFSIMAADGRYLLTIGGLIQGQYSGLFFTKELQWAGSTLGVDRSELLVRRARLIASGHVGSDRVQYRLVLQYGAQLCRQGLLDAFGKFELHRLITIAVGLMRQPFSRQVFTETRNLALIDRSPATTAFGLGRDVGVILSGAVLPTDRYGQLQYRLGVFNGVVQRDGQEHLFDNDDTDFSYTGRLIYQPFGPAPAAEADYAFESDFRVEIGGSANFMRTMTDAAERMGALDEEQVASLRDANEDGNVDKVDILRTGADIAFYFRGVSWQSELFYRRESPEVGDETRNFWGLYSHFATFLRSGFGLAFRYTYWQAHGFGEDASVFHATGAHQLAAAASAFFWNGHLRVVAQYAHDWFRGLSGNLATTDPSRLNAHELQVLTQFRF